MTTLYDIFGLKIKLNGYPCQATEILLEELSLYPTYSPDLKSDIVINFLENLETPRDRIESVNPSIHISEKNSFFITIGSVSARYIFNHNSLIQVDFALNTFKSKIRTEVNKWVNIQFTDRSERIGQLFHELILVPCAILNKNRSIVHAAAVQNKSGEVLLFGGTGGVGKTSLEMTLCRSHECTFFADDICVVDNEKTVYPNLAYPKIYGYNLENNREMERKIFSHLSFLNKLHWRIRKKWLGTSKVRRRVSPASFYDRFQKEGKDRFKYIFLIRSNVPHITIEPLTRAKAARANALIIATEYPILFNHIYWHELNKEMVSKPSFVSFQYLFDKIETVFYDSLKHNEAYMIKVPLTISHRDYKKEMAGLLKSQQLI